MASNFGLSYIVNHVFLPPNLPQGDESDFQNDVALIEVLKEALLYFRQHQPFQEQLRWDNCSAMLSNMLGVRDVCGDLMPENLANSLAEMEIGGVIAIHIRGQNAGLFIRKLPNEVSFESFELSPKTDAVMGAKGRLIRCFPGPVLSIGHDKLEDASFQEALAQLLGQLDVNTPLEALPIVQKASSEAIEVRDTVHPRFVTEMITGILRGVGQPRDTLRIYKRTRDDVLWDNALLPWRRSPLWLLLRVALQTTLMAENDGYRRYKSFMIFCLAQLLQRAVDGDLPSDILFVMAAKINRRILKINMTEKPSWMQYIHRIVEAAHVKLTMRWHSIEQNRDLLGLQSSLSQLCFVPDTFLSLSKLKPYLAAISTRANVIENASKFQPACQSRCKPNETTLPHLAYCSQGGTNATARLTLMDVESWVETALDQWLTEVPGQLLASIQARRNLSSSASCTSLAGLISNYTTSASSNYSNYPEETSLMLLTILDLWVALDRCATHQYPLLRSYEPGFPSSLFDPLLLPKKAQMERLARAEQYIFRRTKEATYSSALLFKDANEPNSFGVQYFQQSSAHQELRRAIENAASIKRERKKAELQRKTEEYRSLMRGYNSRVHDEAKSWDSYKNVWNKYHPGSCEKCRLKNKADSLEIAVHEWPIPYIELEAKSAVFELDVPVGIVKWRDVTYTLLVDVFAPPSYKANTSQRELYFLLNFDGLSGYVKTFAGRLQHASQAKPFVVSHYRNKRISQANESNVCVNNGLHYSIYDSKFRQSTAELLDRCNIRESCTFQLPSGVYKTLQFALDGTTHTSNEVLARQASCPAPLNLHEFYAFAALRSGHRLQWRNIARELKSLALNLSKQETYLLLVQGAWQAGPQESTFYRDSHVDLEEEQFGLSLLLAAQNAFDNFEGNWQGAVSVRIIIMLTTRLLTLSPHTTVHVACYQLLKRARGVALGWARDVERLRHEERDEGEMKVMNLRALEMALTCHGTFDAEPRHYGALLYCNEDVSIITECSIIIHDRCPAITDSLPQYLKLLLRRCERLSCYVEPHLRERILRDQAGMDSTIRQVWEGFQSGGKWVALAEPNERWLVTETSSKGEYSSMIVHYNILDGSLLINGAPLTRLPQEYELHQTYRRILGEKVLDVVPSTMNGMKFEARNTICNQQVHFQMHGPELIIRTRNRQKTCEAIPIHAMDGDFPRAFVQDYVHWFDIETREMEWRPHKTLWIPSVKNWQMQACSRDTFVSSCGNKRMIDIRSPTAKAVSRMLSRLEHATHIHMFLNNETGEIRVHLPRFKLDFILRGGSSSLESKQFRGMAVDNQQSFGSFTGLLDRLVLRETKGSSRSVLVPHGHVSFAPQGHHVRVSINTSSDITVKYHCYQIDTQLGSLVDNGSLQSRLYRLYLHAVTSHCLKDQLTGRTGTEEALFGLTGAASYSFVTLEDSEIELLGKLARLTPHREFYPSHLRVMQQVNWLPLSPISQHSSFHTQVASILRHASMLQVCQETPRQLPTYMNEPMLLERAAIRDSSFQVAGFGAETFTAEHDVLYQARDRTFDSNRETRTYHIARLVAEWAQDLNVCPNLLTEIERWESPIQGADDEAQLTIGFDLEWLDEPVNFLPSCWCSLQNWLSHSDTGKDKYRIMVLLATLSYSPHAKDQVVHTLLAFATNTRFRHISPPRSILYQLSDGYIPVRERVLSLIESNARYFHESPESKLPKKLSESNYDADIRRQQLYQLKKDELVRKFAQNLFGQGLTNRLRTPCDMTYGTHISVENAMKDSRTLFESWYRNAGFKAHIQQVQDILNQFPSDARRLRTYTFQIPPDNYSSRRTHINFMDLANNSAPRLSSSGHNKFDIEPVQTPQATADRSELQELLTQVGAQAQSDHEKQYVRDLFESFEALCKSPSAPNYALDRLTTQLEEHLTQAQQCVGTMYHSICENLQAGLYDLTRTAQMLPRLCPTSILSYLATNTVEPIPDHWKLCFVQYGRSITTLQRADRLLASVRNKQQFLDEIRNPGHENWDPTLKPDWLLFEIENNILIRKEQIDVAEEMICPSTHSNTLSQLNMGLGKSSTIVPIAVVELADGTQLVRVVVLKSLSMQMFQLLAKKLGGLLNRRVYYMPISRSLNPSVHQALQIRQMYEECKNMGSVLLLQPEHILSFELMGPERLFSGNLELGTIMIDTQNWLYDNSRDVLDESDEILSVRFELVYTIGAQRATEFSPQRWSIIQHVLAVLSSVSPEVLQQYPHGLEVISTQGVPRIRILDKLAGDELLHQLAQQLCDNGLPGVPVWNLPLRGRDALFTYLTEPQCPASAIDFLQNSALGSASMKSGLLLLRGLFACGVLSFAFEQKRWRVNYGLHPTRTPPTMLAVPYHAKDTPAARAEFSHPDTTIILTCLSYYYGGLSDEQIRQSFDALLQSDHAQEDYECWVRDAPNLSPRFKHLAGINLSNTGQCFREVFPPLRFSRGMINFFTSTIVFPSQMKEFPHKLSSSGWDLARDKEHPTTGFSGTNDSKYVLPLSIVQRDLPGQFSTNAAVMDCLLKPENSFANEEIRFLDAESLLNLAIVLDPPVRVILDVGAQVLDSQNEEFAHKWLSRIGESEAQAVIFFDKRNELCVLSRDGTKESLQVSPFAKQMDECLVYLDECHTRGTDLKLPACYRALVTLGPGLPKDRLVQACMRMRKLGRGQSVVFCCPSEVQRKILECVGKDEGPVKVSDVLRRSISNTCYNMRRSIPLWATQGVRHQNRRAVYSASSATTGLTAGLVESLLEPEAQTLERRYGLSQDSHDEDQILRLASNQSRVSRGEQLNEIRAKCREFQVFSFDAAALEEEQERELSPENEREVEIELPPALEPLRHHLHEDVRLFITRGRLSRHSKAFRPAFDTLKNTTAARYYESTAWPKDLLVTADFAETVQAPANQLLDFFLRPVHWIVTCSTRRSIETVILSPFEAQELLPSIRKYKYVTLHVYYPRISASMETIEDLSFCAIPPLPTHPLPLLPMIRQINLFAGQLYICNYAEYKILCEFLGLCTGRQGDNVEVAFDGFINPASRAKMDSFFLANCSFKTSPVAFVRMMMDLRRKGQGIEASHMGKILNGELLARDQF